jgi:hypothetical protein
MAAPWNSEMLPLEATEYSFPDTWTSTSWGFDPASGRVSFTGNVLETTYRAGRETKTTLTRRTISFPVPLYLIIHSFLMGMIDEVGNLFPPAPPAPAPEMGGEANLQPVPEPYPDMAVLPEASTPIPFFDADEFLDLDATLTLPEDTKRGETVDSSVESDPSEYHSDGDRDDACSEQTLTSDCSGLCWAAKGDYCGCH